MKKIICYGDSNTFGFNPKNGSKFDNETCWTSLLQKKLGIEYEVINEGMCDRTGFSDNPNGILFSSQKHFPLLISKYNSIDSLILWIGTNDLMFQQDISFENIEYGLKNLIKLAKTKARRIIIIPPVILSDKILEGYFKERFNEESIKKSKNIGNVYIKLANAYNCDFFDVNKYVKPSDFDGLHYDENSQKIIADRLSCLFQRRYLHKD